MSADLTRLNVLCVDDEVPILNVLRKLLEEEYNVLTATGGSQALEQLRSHEIAVALVDQKMPEMTGVELLQKIKEQYPYTVRIILTAYVDIHDLVDSINVGEAFRYITKPWDTDVLLKVIRESTDKYLQGRADHQRRDDYEKLATEKAKLEQEIVVLKTEIGKEFALDNIVSISPEMNHVRRLISTAALSDETALIHGESGTGKELVARAIHFNSKRQHNKFIAVDCGALTESLLEGELFGYKKGSFTSASYDKKGLFEEASGGTLFLDEISNTSLALQSRLLRVIQEKEIRRIGELEYRPVDVRIITATNRDLYELCREGRFREDLYYRLHVIPIKIPPLRERRNDIPLLINHIINEHNEKSAKKIHSIAKDALNFLCSREWKGNIRELRNVISRMLIFAQTEHLDMNDVPDELRGETAVETATPGPAGVPFVVTSIRTLQDVEREYIRHVLRQTGSNKAEAAKRLGMKRTTLIMRMKKLGLMP
jgi:two-component system response regulator HupR/HoxA